jgi:hypothetical protein
MAFTSTDLSNIEEAIRKLYKGIHVVECSIDGDLIRYQRTDLDDMLKLREQIKKEIAEAAASTSYSRARVAVTTKGY